MSGLDDTVHSGKTFTHYEQHNGKVTAFFDDGSRATGDLLVRRGRRRLGGAPAIPPARQAGAD
ncbi:MAG: hypothetical protein ACRDRY_21485 [Pseudonocardiaceae bacterium]